MTNYTITKSATPLSVIYKIVIFLLVFVGDNHFTSINSCQVSFVQSFTIHSTASRRYVDSEKHFCSSLVFPAARTRSVLFSSDADEDRHHHNIIVTTQTNATNSTQPAVLKKELANTTTHNNVETTFAEPTAKRSAKDNVSLSIAADGLHAQIDRITRPREYPLFLAEKAAEFIESTVEDLTKPLNSIVSTKAFGNSIRKERLVLLGSGWGAASFLKEIDTDVYDVTIVSPRNYFLFTPMLVEACVGTVNFRTICEPIQEFSDKAIYLEALATEIDPTRKIVTCQSTVPTASNNNQPFKELEEVDISYDRLIVTVGARTNTFNIPGVRQHCLFLRELEDARRIRSAILHCFERAKASSTDAERQTLLTFAIVGAGPTGIEFAAELRDFIEQDGPKYYPDLIKHVRIKIIQASSTVLAPFEKALQQEAIAQFRRDTQIKDANSRYSSSEKSRFTELLLDSPVKEVDEKKIHLQNGRTIAYGVVVWAAGNGPLPITSQLVDALGKDQVQEQNSTRGRLAVDPWMRVLGANGTILAFGDCSCMIQNEVPATAQVASQQGEYLGKIMNRQFNFSPPRLNGVLPPPTRVTDQTQTTLSDAIANIAIGTTEFAKPFQFLNLGILAYTGGGTALAQITPLPDAVPFQGSGIIGNAIWRAVYLSKQFSWRNRFLVVNDWAKGRLFGRDPTRM